LESDKKDTILPPELNRAPKTIRHIHLMGICGTGMASLAGILKDKGYLITGSDRNVYPPMSHFLERLSIKVSEGYGPENLASGPDLVIVGNVITRHNPEAIELSRLKIPYLSFPQALSRFALKGKKSIVICGTHGKTTTSSVAAWILDQAGMDPLFMIGGIPAGFDSSFRLGKGPYCVVEGDEYDTAFFDKGPKFLHYSPMIVILTSVEFDHADIYRDLDHVKESFGRLMDIIPADGLLIANADDPAVMDQAAKAGCRVITYGLSENALFRAQDISYSDKGTKALILKGDEPYLNIVTPLYGRHNISNMLSTAALSSYLDIPRQNLAGALSTFKGVKRRQEKIGEAGGILVLDDFAHHPTAVRETVRGVKERFKGRRLVAVFEPRSNSSRRSIFQKRYAASFDKADMILIPEPALMEKIPPEERFSSKGLVADLTQNGKDAFYFETTDKLLNGLLKKSEKGDVVLFMSNGGFDNLQRRFYEGLKDRD